MLSLIVLIALIRQVELVQLIAQPSAGDYGPYNIDFANYALCRGPKINNTTKLSSIIFKEGDSYKTIINITFFSPTSVDEAKLILFNIKENRKNMLLSYKLDKPCQHFAIGALIAQFTRNTECIARKGSVSVELNFSEISRLFFGKAFFYGEYYFKALVLSKKGNMLCLTFNSIFSKPTQNVTLNNKQ